MLLEEAIVHYWQKRSSSYGAQHYDELHAPELKKWQDFIQAEFKKADRPIQQVLDIGTGPGFLAILLALRGYEVTAIDFTKEMLAEAQKNAAEFSEGIQHPIYWQEMRADALDYPDESFDAVVTRNVTWNLEDPEKAYAEWVRVLKPGGILINFDANWYRYLFDDAMLRDYQSVRQNVKELAIRDFYQNTDIDAMEGIAQQIPMGKKWRPDWDKKYLQGLGMTKIDINEAINSLLLSKVQQENFAFAPLFAISAIK